METIRVCKVCLSINVKMFKIKNTPLQAVYEKLTDIPLDKDGGGGQSVCYECAARLQGCHKLQRLALDTHRTLTRLLGSKHSISESSVAVLRSAAHRPLSVRVLGAVAVSEQQDAQDEPPEPGQPAPREDDADDGPGAQLSDGDHDGSDSEDDRPLNTIASSGGKRRHKPEAMRHSSERLLSAAQQAAELAARASSLNYLNSPYRCALCYRGFVHAHAYRNHQERHSEASGPLECGVCRLRYRSARQLRAHAASAHERRYVCHRCQHVSHTKNQALVHERWHAGQTYPCGECGATFSRPTTYLTHTRKAHGAHVCTVCGHSFVGRHGLLMHLSKAHRSHQTTAAGEAGGGAGAKSEAGGEAGAEEERRCAPCGVVFVSREALARHALSSPQHAPWDRDSESCRICGARVESELVREHLREHARALRPAADTPPSAPLAALPCDQCGAVFASRARLAAHVRGVHLGLKYDRNIICELCGKKCTSAARLRLHQRAHGAGGALRPHGCGACGARFASRGSLRLHARTHSGERPYACAVCGKTFSQKPALNRHYRVHTGARPYPCALCGKAFSQSNSVKLHVNSVHLKLAPRGRRQPPGGAPQPAPDAANYT